MKYRLTRQARRDVLHIWTYIAEDNEDAADRFFDPLIQHFAMLGKTLMLAGLEKNCAPATAVSLSDNT
jgi:plasmid stabilization system protein ParE